MIRIDESQLDIVFFQITGEIKPIVPRGLTAHNDLLGGCNGRIGVEVRKKALEAFLAVIEAKHFLGQFLSAPVERSGKICLAADIYTNN